MIASSYVLPLDGGGYRWTLYLIRTTIYEFNCPTG